MPTRFRLARYNARLAQAEDGLIDIVDLAQTTGIHPDLVRRLYGLGLLESATEWHGEPLFEPGTVLRLRRMARLRQDLGISWHGLALAADLLERIDSLEARVRELKARR